MGEGENSAGELALIAAVQAAKDYNGYDPIYNYGYDSIDIQGNVATITYSGSKLLELNSSDPAKTIMDDMARYLGALYYHDNGETVAAIDYSNGSYSWGTKKRKGSNWDLDGNSFSLVSMITLAFKADPSNFDTIELTLKDANNNSVNLTLSIVVTED